MKTVLFILWCMFVPLLMIISYIAYKLGYAEGLIYEQDKQQEKKQEEEPA